MINFIEETNLKQPDIAEVYVIDYNNQTDLIDAHTAFYVKSDLIKSPMAGGLAAFSSQEQRHNQQQKWQGQELVWDEVNAINK